MTSPREQLVRAYGRVHARLTDHLLERGCKVDLGPDRLPTRAEYEAVCAVVDAELAAAALDAGEPQLVHARVRWSKFFRAWGVDFVDGAGVTLGGRIIASSALSAASTGKAEAAESADDGDRYREALGFLLRGTTGACRYHGGAKGARGVYGDDYDPEPRPALWEKRWQMSGDGRGLCDRCRDAMVAKGYIASDLTELPGAPAVRRLLEYLGGAGRPEAPAGYNPGVKDDAGEREQPPDTVTLQAELTETRRLLALAEADAARLRRAVEFFADDGHYTDTYRHGAGFVDAIGLTLARHVLRGGDIDDPDPYGEPPPGEAAR